MNDARAGTAASEAILMASLGWHPSRRERRARQVRLALALYHVILRCGPMAELEDAVALRSGLYLWVKAVHVIAVIAWMAGMLYLPRLFVYHCEAEPGSKQSETFKVMERRLLRAIINPAMVATWVLGLWLGWQGGWLRRPGSTPSWRSLS